jgi:hypothetical protein
MLLVAVVVVFGGLTAATIFLIRKPQVDSYPPMPAALVGDQD